jgi:hypothetical protein
LNSKGIRIYGVVLYSSLFLESSPSGLILVYSPVKAETSGLSLQQHQSLQFITNSMEQGLLEKPTIAQELNKFPVFYGK